MNTATLITLCSALLVATPTAQNINTTAKTERSTPMYASLVEVLDGNVVLEADWEARQEAMKDGEKAERPYAKISDVIMTRGGEVRLASLSVGGLLGIGDRTVLIPISSLRPIAPSSEEAKEADFALQMTEAELKALPEFDASAMAEKNQLDRAFAAVEASFPKRSNAREATSAPMSERYVLASDAMKLDVKGSDEEFGTVSDAMIDMRQRRVDYLVVTHGATLGLGGDQYLVPMAAARITEKSADSSDCVLMLSKPVAELKNCTKYAEPEDSNEVLTAEQCKLANECYGTEAPSMDSKENGGRPRNQ